ncbi:MAG TPA: hypothetical protein VN700_03065 [Vicinamibacterales bacterium]|nr:hypothetical protein [Vicinamibacterales bacterium]
MAGTKNAAVGRVFTAGEINDLSTLFRNIEGVIGKEAGKAVVAEAAAGVVAMEAADMSPGIGLRNDLVNVVVAEATTPDR